MKTKKWISNLMATLLSFINLTSDGAFFTHISDGGGGQFAPPLFSFMKTIERVIRLCTVLIFSIGSFEDMGIFRNFWWGMGMGMLKQLRLNACMQQPHPTRGTQGGRGLCPQWSRTASGGLTWWIWRKYIDIITSLACCDLMMVLKPMMGLGVIVNCSFQGHNSFK